MHQPIEWLDQDRPDRVERRSGQDRRRRADRRSSGKGQPAAQPERLCFVCGGEALAHDSFPVRIAEGLRAMHGSCAFHFTRDVLDLLHRFQMGAVRPLDVPQPRLSAREIQVLEGLVAGERDREIAARLGVAEHTVKNHAYEIRRKLGVRSRTEAAVRAMQLGLLSQRKPNGNGAPGGQPEQ